MWSTTPLAPRPKTWTLYLRTHQGDHFLQKSEDLETLKRANQASVNRWISQMGLTVSRPEHAMLGLTASNRMEFEARYVAGGRRVWNPVAANSSEICNASTST